MKLKTAVQLYSIREWSALDFADAVKIAAIIGFSGVEPAGLYGLKPAEFKKIVNDLGMEISSSHGPWLRSVDDVGKAVDDLGAMGLQTAVCGFGPNEFKDMDTIKRTAELVNQIQEKTQANGLTLFQHNHYWEFEKLDGRLKYEIYAELCPNVKFEIDSYWSANFGANDPAEMMKKFADRTILVHMKDGTLERDMQMMPLGSGKLPIPRIIDVVPANVKWLIVELDNCVVDMYRGLKKSYQYLTQNGLTVGNR